MGRVEDNHSSEESEGGTKGDHYPDIPDKMVPRLEQEEHQMRHFKRCENPRTFAFQELRGFRRQTCKHEQIASANELTDSVGERVVEEVVSRKNLRIGEGDCSNHG